MNDYLKSQNVDVKFPRDTIKESFKYALIDDGDLWMDMLDKRNLMSHTYNETSADLAYSLISGSYYNAHQHCGQQEKSVMKCPSMLFRMVMSCFSINN